MESVLKWQLGEVTKLDNVIGTGITWIVVGFVLVGLDKDSAFKLRKTLEGILEHYSGRWVTCHLSPVTCHLPPVILQLTVNFHLSPGRYLHFVIVTDKKTRGQAASHITKVITGWVVFHSILPPFLILILLILLILISYFFPSPRWVGRGAIEAPGWRWRRQRAIPHLRISMVRRSRRWGSWMRRRWGS